MEPNITNYNSVTILSDIHIGSPVCNSESVLQILDNLETELLVINGDLFDSFNARLCKHQWKILSKLRKLSDEIDIVWVTGNHDELEPHPEFIGSLIGIRVLPEFRFTFNNKKIICIHGHIWDKFISNHPILTNIADFIYGCFQRLDKNHRIARWLKNTSKTFLRNKDIIREEAIKYCIQEEFDIIVCGHTHFAENVKNYYNSGCFTEKPAHYIENLEIKTI